MCDVVVCHFGGFFVCQEYLYMITHANRSLLQMWRVGRCRMRWQMKSARHTCQAGGSGEAGGSGQANGSGQACTLRRLSADLQVWKCPSLTGTAQGPVLPTLARAWMTVICK
jgi:hypothetical protein